jgi:8-oxo-dGTP diphosphatase
MIRDPRNQPPEFMPTAAAPAARIVDVAAAVILQADGQFLLARRPEGRAYAGYWEFPGGKIEAGEDARAALVRELHEELGIDVDEACPWLTRVYAYPETTVRLHFFRVRRWHGAPRAREGQELSWQTPNAPTVAPLLPANGPVLKALTLPAIYAITKADRLGVTEFMNRVQDALDGGVRLIQVRERGLSPRQLEKFARAVVKLAHLSGARAVINADAALALRLGADGVHLQAGQLQTLNARPDLPLVGASCHDPAELARAAELGCDFAVLSPVLPTVSHPGSPGLGWERFAELVKDTPLPVYALGGIRMDLLDTAQQHGAHGICLLSGIW